MSFNSYGFRYDPNASHAFREARPKSKFGFHGGEDRPAPAGTPVPAQFDGKVFRSGSIYGYGNAVVVESTAPNGRKFYTLYGHLGPDGLPAVGADVKAGKSLLGNVGTEAFVNSFPGADIKGTHLHWEIISDKAGLHQNGPLGIVSSDTAHRANPDTFDINNPFFPYEGEVPLPRPRPDLGDRRDGNQTSAPSTVQSADASPSFDDRFSAIYNSPPAGAGNFAGQSIPFVARPAGSLSTSGESSFLNSTPINPGVTAPFAAGTEFIPGPLSSRPLYPTERFVTPQSFPNSPTPQNNRRSDIPDVVMPTRAQAAPPSGLTSASPDPNASASLFSRLLSLGPDALFGADDTASPPLQPDATQNLADTGPTRFLVGRTYDPSQGSPFAAPPVWSQPSPGGSLSLNDAYLEYLSRLKVA